MSERERDWKVTKRKADRLKRKKLSSKKQKLENIDTTPNPRQEHRRMKSKHTLKTARQADRKDESRGSNKSPPLKSVSQDITEKLAQDDAEIAFLEKKLGLKSRKSLPKEFINDGLDELLDGLYGNNDDIGENQKIDEREWFARKRHEAQKSPACVDKKNKKGEFKKGISCSEGYRARDFLNRDDCSVHTSQGEDVSLVDSEIDSTSSDFEAAVGISSAPSLKVIENPYVAPTAAKTRTSVPKNFPVLLKVSSPDSEDIVRLRKQAQGAVNRLTEANFISILGDIENLYQTNIRQHVTSTLVNILLTSICDTATLSDAFTILLAGFVTAIYKVIGIDFGAQFIQGAVELFDELYVCAGKTGSGKETSNIISLLAGLYNFHTLGSNLIFDYLRLFLETLSELTTELLLKIIRISGSQLRQEDQTSLKDIVNILRLAVAKSGSESISARSKFMIEMINDLRTNRVKTGFSKSTVISEHTIRMKKILGALSNRNMKASEPLNVCLRDIRESGKKGKWWLIGASWAENEKHKGDDHKSVVTTHEIDKHIFGEFEGDVLDFTKLAREQRMNTDVRQTIFITIISASDFQDAYHRLMKLKLKKRQELEIPKVLIHCLGTESDYNHYYTLLAKKLCRHRSLKVAFRFSLWDIFKKFGENCNEDDADEDSDDKISLNMRQLVNLARMFGSLITDESLTLSILKYLNFKCLKPKTKVFTEVLLVTVLLQSQANIEPGRGEISLTRVMSNIENAPQVAEGLFYFIKKVVSNADLSSEAEKEKIRRGCKIAVGVLRQIMVGYDGTHIPRP